MLEVVNKVAVYINELEVEASKGETVFTLKDRYKSDADVVILNGFPIKEDAVIHVGDRISLIKRGEIPTKQQVQALMVARHTPGVHNSVKDAVVGIAGVGGLGSNIAISLARVGVGKLILVDFDVVEPSNLNRQQYYIRHIGMYKVDALSELLKEINPFIKVEVYKIYLDESNISEIFMEARIVIEAFDNAVCKAILANEILVNNKEKYFIAGSGMAGYFSSNSVITRKIGKKFFLCGDGENEAKVGSGLMAPRVAIVANHMANMAVRLLCEEVEP